MDSLEKAQSLVNAMGEVEHPLYRGAAVDSKIRDSIVSMAASRGDMFHIATNTIASFACPIVALDNPNLMSIFASPEHAKALRRTTGKPGKLLGKILIGATEQEKESFAVWWRESIVLPRQGFQVYSTQDGKEIARVYCETQAQASDPALTARGWKSLSASCMRYSFSELKCHPATVYGSGDWTLFYVANGQGHIAARAIVATRKGRFVPGPIYTNSNVAGDMLEKALQAESEKPRDGEDVESKTWVNCRLTRIESHCGGLIAPYLDLYASAVDMGDSLRISKHGEIELTSTQGVVYPGGRYTCDDCGCGMGEDESYHDDNGNCYCESCYCERFTQCEHCYDTVDRDDMVNILDWRGRAVDCACRYCVRSGEIDAIEIDGELHDLDSVVFDSDDNPHVLDSGTYFVSDLTGEVHTIDDRQELPNGDMCSLSEAIETGNWTLVSERVVTGTYTDSRGERQERAHIIRRLVLRPWLELDSRGEVINRQPELFNIGLPGEACEAMGEAA